MACIWHFLPFVQDTSIKVQMKNIYIYIIKKIKKLIIPMYIYNIVYGLIVQISRFKGFEMGGDFNLYNICIAPIINGDQFIYNLGGWFLVPLFLNEIYNVFIRKFLKRFNSTISEWTFFIIGLVLGLVGNQFACVGNRGGWMIVLIRTFHFIPFYSLGILYKNKLETIDKMIPSFWYFVVIYFFKLVIIYHFGRVPSYTSSWCNDFIDGPIMPIVVGYLGIALWMRIATILEPVIGKSKWINLIADNTYSIMMNQFLGFMLVKTIYAIISKIYEGFSNFDLASYKTDIWWYYYPKGINHTLIIYVVAGIIIPILIQKIINEFKKIF